MSWEIFKQNVLNVVSNPESINDIDLVAKTFATEYDAAVKRGGDSANLIPLKAGNIQLMEQIFKSALQKGLSSTEPYDLVGEMGKGVIAYWTGATLSDFPIPIIPAVGSAQNVGVFTNFISNTGTWAPVIDSLSANFKLTPELRAEYQNRLDLAFEKYQAAIPVEPPPILKTHEEKISALTNILTNDTVYRIDIPYPKPIITAGTKTVDVLGNLIEDTDGDFEGREDLGGTNGPVYSSGGSGGGFGGGQGFGGYFKQSVPYFPAGASVSQKVIAIALTDLNDEVKEIPDASNTGHPRLLVIQKTGAGGGTGFPWCACAVYTWWKEAGFPFTDDPNDPNYLTYPANCNNWYPWAVRTGRWVEKRNGANPNYIPNAGDAVLYSTDFATYDHIGLVYAYADNKLTSLDGNYRNAVSFNLAYTRYVAGYIKI